MHAPSTSEPQNPAPAPSEATAAEAPSDKSRFKFQKLLQPFTVDRDIVTPILWFLLDWLVMGTAIATLLVVESLWIKVFASLVAALWIARLFVIGHDACHGSYTPNKTLNQWIGRIAFLPSLTPTACGRSDIIWRTTASPTSRDATTYGHPSRRMNSRS